MLPHFHLDGTSPSPLSGGGSNPGGAAPSSGLLATGDRSFLCGDMFRADVGLVLASGVGGLKVPLADIVICVCLLDLLGGPMGPRPTEGGSLSSSSKL